MDPAKHAARYLNAGITAIERQRWDDAAVALSYAAAQNRDAVPSSMLHLRIQMWTGILEAHRGHIERADDILTSTLSSAQQFDLTRIENQVLRARARIRFEHGRQEDAIVDWFATLQLESQHRARESCIHNIARAAAILGHRAFAARVLSTVPLPSMKFGFAPFLPENHDITQEPAPSPRLSAIMHAIDHLCVTHLRRGAAVS